MKCAVLRVSVFFPVFITESLCWTDHCVSEQKHNNTSGDPLRIFFRVSRAGVQFDTGLTDNAASAANVIKSTVKFAFSNSYLR